MNEKLGWTTSNEPSESMQRYDGLSIIQAALQVRNAKFSRLDMQKTFFVAKLLSLCYVGLGKNHQDSNLRFQCLVKKHNFHTALSVFFRAK